MDRSPWEPMTDEEYDRFQHLFQRSARKRGKMPDAVYVMRDADGRFESSAMQYIEDGKWERWGLRVHPEADIVESWSTILTWIRPLIGDRTAIEVYPRDEYIINTAPIRWFWVVPTDDIPSEFDLANRVLPEPEPSFFERMVSHNAHVSDDVVVHYLSYGNALCRKPGIPFEWKEGHLWTQLLDTVTCEECKIAYANANKGT